jgi:hypothetical protein
MSPEETADLWLTAQRVGQKIEPFFKATSLTFAIQVLLAIAHYFLLYCNPEPSHNTLNIFNM